MDWVLKNVQWIFDGWGTAIVTTLIGFAGGWAAKGYSVRQNMMSGADSKSIQAGRDIRIEK